MGSKNKAMSSGTSVGIARHDSQQDDFTTQQPPSKRRRGNPPKDKVIGKGGLLTPSSPSNLESASVSLCEPKLTSVHEPRSVHQAINSEEEKDIPLLRARIPYKAKKIMPEAWKRYLIPLFEEKCSEERAKRLQPFRLEIAYGRLGPLTNCAHGTAENALEGVDVNRPIIWTKKDHVHDDVKDIRAALENAFFCAHKEPQGQRYQADHARVEVHDTHNNPVNRSIMQAYNDPTRSPLYYVINVPIPEYVFPICDMLAKREHIYHENGDPKSHYGGNYTPEGVCVDIHIDHGGRGSTWHGEGPKLWVFYPPTSKNVELLCKHLQQDMRYGLIEAHLEGGCYAVFFSGQTVEIPCGWLHATYAIRSGFVNGTNWWCAEGLLITSEIFSQEIRLGIPKYIDDILIFLRTLWPAAFAEDGRFRDIIVEGLRLMCPKKTGKPLADFVKGKRNNKSIKEMAGKIRERLKKTIPDATCDTCDNFLGHIDFGPTK